jgi:hypothetical protein
MNDPSKKWGDIFWKDIQEMEHAEMAAIPKLVYRKDIWTNFPVHVIPLGSDENGAECHKIVWNRNRLESEIQNVARSTIESRLMKALKNSERWTVHPSRSTDSLATICMKFKNATNSEDISHQQIPTLKHIYDIKKYFPVVWHQLEPNMYGLSFHLKNLENYGKRKGLENRNTMIVQMLQALQSSTAWRVLYYPNDKYFCRLLINNTECPI